MTHATTVLKQFIDSTQGELEEVKRDHLAAKENYEKVVEFFGENVKQTNPQTFFGTFARFSTVFKKAIEVSTQYCHDE